MESSIYVELIAKLEGRGWGVGEIQLLGLGQVEREGIMSLPGPIVRNSRVWPITGGREMNSFFALKKFEFRFS